jgi:hypothetical protein
VSADAAQDEAPKYIRKHAAFESYFERDANREKRRKGRRNTLILSLVVHGVALGMLVLYSLWDVEELWAPPVKVKVYKKSAVPAEVLAVPDSKNVLPDPLRR